MLIESGSKFTCPYPFVMDTYDSVSSYDGEIYSEDVWRPGVRYDGDEAVADNSGSMVLDVISIHKPGKYPERIFFIRTWIDPDGKVFGKKRLRMATRYAFEKLTQGYRYPVIEI